MGPPFLAFARRHPGRGPHRRQVLGPQPGSVPIGADPREAKGLSGQQGQDERAAQNLSAAFAHGAVDLYRRRHRRPALDSLHSYPYVRL